MITNRWMRVLSCPVDSHPDKTKSALSLNSDEDLCRGSDHFHARPHISSVHPGSHCHSSSQPTPHQTEQVHRPTQFGQCQTGSRARNSCQQIPLHILHRRSSSVRIASSLGLHRSTYDLEDLDFLHIEIFPPSQESFSIHLCFICITSPKPTTLIHDKGRSPG